MLGMMSEVPRNATRRNKIDKLIQALIELYGPDACDVIERQIMETAGEDAQSTWNEIWERLCASKGHPR
jgi:hypothetical protein